MAGTVQSHAWGNFTGHGKSSAFRAEGDEPETSGSDPGNPRLGVSPAVGEFISDPVSPAHVALSRHADRAGTAGGIMGKGCCTVASSVGETKATPILRQP